MTRTLFAGGRIRLGHEVHDWALLDDSTLVGSGPTGDSPRSDRIVDLDGGTLTHAFCDAHVHLPATGLYALGMDFRGERSVDAIRKAFAARGSDSGALLFGGNFEDPLDEPLDRSVLDAAVGNRPALLARADMHSCVVSSALLNELDVADLEGVDRDADGVPTGYLRERASAEAWRWFESNLGAPQLTQAVRRAVDIAGSKGVTSVHEMFVVEWRGWGALDWFLEAVADAAIEVVTYVGTDDVGRVKELGHDRIGGDYFLDGSFGSHTAWMNDPYDPAPPPGSPRNGISYRSDEDLFGFFMDAQDAGMQVGVHAIGDAAIEQAIGTWERVAEKVGDDQIVARGHRIEHFECATDDHIARSARLGLRVSVQPAFDLLWGGEDGFYTSRIGWERARVMNRFKSMHASELVVGAGSDSTVTPLDPLLQMKALRSHHLAAERLEPEAALDIHTRGSRALAHREVPGGDLVWLDRDPVTTAPDELTTIRVRGTWRDGICIWPQDER